MFKSVIDAHIHFDLYKEAEQEEIIQSLEEHNIEGLITVSEHLESAERNLKLAEKYEKVYPAFGYHPEQSLPEAREVEKLIDFIMNHQEKMIAIGEVGLPYYLRKKQGYIELERYIDLLETFIITAKKTAKPIVLHAVYEDAPIVCGLLEKHSIEKAHFHWFKGDSAVIERIRANGYFISIAPDILYEQEIQEIAKGFPIEQLMVETDGPWPFEGPFENKMTHPKMMHYTLETIAKLKGMSRESMYKQIYKNTKEFFQADQQTISG